MLVAGGRVPRRQGERDAASQLASSCRWCFGEENLASGDTFKERISLGKLESVVGAQVASDRLSVVHRSPGKPQLRQRQSAVWQLSSFPAAPPPHTGRLASMAHCTPPLHRHSHGRVHHLQTGILPLPLLQVTCILSFHLITPCFRSLSCPDISQGKRPVMPAHHTQSRRHINMMILNPRASKIRYLNASHTLLVDLEKHVRKVQVYITLL